MAKQKKLTDIYCKHCNKYLCSARPDTETFCPNCCKWVKEKDCRDKEAVKI